MWRPPDVRTAATPLSDGLGGGANIVGGTGNVILSNLWAGGFYADQWLMNATAREDEDGASDAWHMTLNQICVDD